MVDPCEGQWKRTSIQGSWTVCGDSILEVMLQWTLEGMREKDFPSFKKLMSPEMGVELGFTTSRQKGKWRKWG